MEFTVVGKYEGLDARLTWKNGELTSTPEIFADIIKLHDGLLMTNLGNQDMIFDLSEFENAYLFLTTQLLTDVAVVGDQPTEESEVVY